MNNIAKHGRLFKLACIAESILQEAANREQKKYDTCRNYESNTKTLSDYSKPGEICRCNMFQVSNEDFVVPEKF